MGEHLFVVTLVTLFMLFWIDVFRSWYTRFLEKRGMSARNIRNMLRIQWAVLALIFWYTLLHRGMPEELSITHFAFSLFVFSLYGLLRSTFSKKKGD